MKILCTCGASFANEREWREHYLIGKPNLVSASRLTGISEEKAAAWNEHAKRYDTKHQLTKSGTIR